MGILLEKLPKLTTIVTLTHHLELYNLKDDLGEEHNLAGEQPERANELRDKLHAWRKTVQAQLPTPQPSK